MTARRKGRRRTAAIWRGAAGIMATPANSAYNELVIEAGRLSILNSGREVVIHYGENARVALA